MPKEVELSNLRWNDYWTIAVRQRWFLLGPFFALGLLGFAAALVWPERYRSEALILVEPQKVPEQYVTPNVVVNVQDRLQSMREQILSRTRLQRLIEQFDLYPKERAGKTMTELVGMMRRDITIEPEKGSTQTGELTAFRITYIAPEAKVARTIVNELTALCIDDNLRARDQQSTDTTQFLENQLADARHHLAETEQRLRDYKMEYLGELPEQEQSNLQILSSSEAQLNAATAELDRLEQDKTYLESMKAGYKSLGPAVISRSEDPSRPASLPDLQAKLADLQAKYTDRYPEVIRTREEIARLQAIQQRPQKGSEASDSSKSSGTDSPGGDNAQPGLIEMDSRLKAVRVDIEGRENEVNALRQKIRSIQSHLNLTPVREQQLAEVSRDYDNAKAQYQSLLQKESQSALATNLEKRQEGEQFRIIDPASLPEKSVEPNRAEISLGGWCLGLMAGIGLTVLTEIANTGLHGEQDVKSVSVLPILVSVPDLPSPQQEAVASRNRWIEALTVTLLVAASLGFGSYFYFWMK